MQTLPSPRIWIRVFSWTWLDKLANNFKSSNWIPQNGCPIAGFLVHEAYPNVDMTRLKTAIDSVRSLGFVANPGMVWHIGSDEPDPYKKWEKWTNRMSWVARCSKLREMNVLQDAQFPFMSVDLELYSSSGQEHCPWEQFEKAYYACDSVETMLSPYHLVVTQYCESFPQNRAFVSRLKRLTWIEEAYWGLPWKEGQALADDMLAMQKTKNMLKDFGRGYMPQTVQSVCRDYALPVRHALANAGIDDVFSWLDATEDDVNLFGTTAWKIRPKEPPVAPDPSKIGQMAFDVDMQAVSGAIPVPPLPSSPPVPTTPVGPLQSISSITATPGSVAPTFVASVPAFLSTNIAGKPTLLFDGVQGQGFRTSFSRQLSADYTLFFVGLPPSWKNSNDGTGWLLGPTRFYCAQAPSARWNWGGTFALADSNRHVICCEQSANGKRSILVDGVVVGTSQDPPCTPDGTMTIGNIDSLTARPVKMEMDRLTVYEGVLDRTKTMDLMRKYCQWYGIPWRGDI